jgi:hypothetical protein
MGERREWRSFAVVMLVIAACCAAVTSCGSGGKSASTNGDLCDQCGDTDGPCNNAGADVTGNDLPIEGCLTDPCHVRLTCLRKVDSGQRRCYPVNPITDRVDLFYECDGSRPGGTPVVSTSTATPTLSPTPTPTATPTGPTPTATESTSTGATPTPTATSTAVAGPEDVNVDVDVSTEADNFVSGFTVTVTYPTDKGSFGGNTVNCGDDVDGLTTSDDGSGTLTLTVPGDSNGFTDVTITCVFHQKAGQTAAETEFHGSADSNQLTVEVTI